MNLTRPLDQVSWLHASREKPLHPVHAIMTADPILDLEVRDPQRRREAVMRREDVGQRVPERALAVPSAIAGKQRRHGPAEATTLEFSLGVGPRDPEIGIEGERHVVFVTPQRRCAVDVEVLLGGF